MKLIKCKKKKKKWSTIETFKPNKVQRLKNKILSTRLLTLLLEHIGVVDSASFYSASNSSLLSPTLRPPELHTCNSPPVY